MASLLGRTSSQGRGAATGVKKFSHIGPSAAEPQPKKTFNHKERKGRREEGTHHEGTKDTKNELKKVNHKGHKVHIGRKARELKFLRPLPCDRLRVVLRQRLRMVSESRTMSLPFEGFMAVSQFEGPNHVPSTLLRTCFARDNQSRIKSPIPKQPS